MSEYSTGAAALQHVADELRLRLELGLLRARSGEIAIRFAERLARQRGAVGADEQVGLGAEFLDLRFGLGDPLAHASISPASQWPAARVCSWRAFCCNER